MPGADTALPRYFQVIKGKTKPLFKMLRKVECQKQDSLESMWAEHERAMELFRLEKEKGFSGIAESEDALYSLLDLKHEISLELLKSCVFCERRCKVNRAEGKKGWCRMSAVSHVASMFEHIGEESMLTPSGTIFFAGCTWSCAYCQNWDISQFPQQGRPMSGENIAQWIDGRAQANLIINANFVGGDPTPNLHTILGAIKECKSNTPMIWNSNMYLSVETIKLLEGVIDVYLADFRYGNDKCAMRLSKVPKYWETATRNFKQIAGSTEMIIRILVLPNHVEDDAGPILKWIGENIADKCYVNLMSQYFPRHKAREYEEISKPLARDQFEKAVEYLKQYSIIYFEIQ
jgi:putative pyruvate formate lyase activating enzyme